jgi:hypothetical protein
MPNHENRKNAFAHSASIAGKVSAPIPGWLLGVVAAMPLLSAAAAFAHHSPAVFDRTRQIEIAGVVREFRWGNPHSWIHLDVADDEGRVSTWSVEMDPATMLGREGWTRRTLAPGDRVEVKVYPLRNDEKGGQYISVELPDGTVMDEDRPPLEVVRP